MISWCSYCQAFLGERAPYDDVSFTHSICEACVARVRDAAEQLIDETALPRALIRELIQYASAGDEVHCAEAIERARSAGVDDTSILVGVLQPVLYEIGRAWSDATASIADEHRVTSWVERTFALLSTPTRPAPDVLLLLAPGNTHTIGPRFAAELLSRMGFSAVALYPDLPVDEIAREIEAARPTLVGVSCALPAHIAPARELVATLAAQAPRSCRFLLGGLAFRSAPDVWAGDPLVAITLDDVMAVLREPSARGVPLCQ